MENRIYQITKDELNSIKQQLNSKSNTWIAEIDGDNISTWQDYADEIERVFKFPANIIEMHVNGLSIDGYLDWITDLSWLNANGYALIINNFDIFMSGDLRKKEIIIESFEKNVLPWWQSQVEQYQVGGNAKPFNVYVVD